VNDVLVTPYTPTLRDGTGLRTYGIVRALAHWRPVEVVHAEFGAGEPAPEYLALEQVRLRSVRASRGRRRALAYARARVAGVPHAFARGVTPELAGAAGEAAEAAGGGRVIADGPTVAAALRGLAGRRPVIYNAHNLESTFRKPERGSGIGSTAGLRRFERAIIGRYAESWMVSHADADAARELVPDAALRYVPNVIDVDAIEPVTASGEPVLLFVADYTYAPNREGLEFLLAEVLPRVWERRPDACLRLVGRGLEGPPSSDERVIAEGFVEDLRAAYAEAACAVVPLLRGGGTPLKLLEALCYGLPVVATPAASAGLELAPDLEYLEGDGAEGFATAVLRALDGDASKVVAAGRRAVTERYSVETLTRLLAP
jgi:glycosyltransferase involved in cell wall biosynthesis